MEPPSGHALMFMALLDHYSTAVAAAALAALACCVECGNTAQARLLLLAAPVLVAAIRNGEVAAAAAAAKPDAVPTVVLHAALPFTLPHLDGAWISEEAASRGLQALAPAATGAARYAAGCAAVLPQAEVLPPDVFLQLVSAAYLLNLVSMQAPEALQTMEVSCCIAWLPRMCVCLLVCCVPQAHYWTHRWVLTCEMERLQPCKMPSVLVDDAYAAHAGAGGRAGLPAAAGQPDPAARWLAQRRA